MLFTIPVSNGHLERCFSQMKVLKTDKTCCLSEKRLDELLRIRLESPPLGQWMPKVQFSCGGKTKLEDLLVQPHPLADPDNHPVLL